MPVWLTLIGLTQYEQALIDAGYDDIDFISDITSEELEDIGITKKGECFILPVDIINHDVFTCRSPETIYAWDS